MNRESAHYGQGERHRSTAGRLAELRKPQVAISSALSIFRETVRQPDEPPASKSADLLSSELSPNRTESILSPWTQLMWHNVGRGCTTSGENGRQLTRAGKHYIHGLVENKHLF